MSIKNIKKYHTYGEALSDTLAERGLNQSWLADKADIDNAQITRYVKNKYTPSKKRQKLFGQLLGVDFVQVGDKWEVKTKDQVQAAVDSVNRLEDAAAEYKDGKPTRDDVIRQLELAESLIRNTRDILSKMKSGD